LLQKSFKLENFDVMRKPIVGSLFVLFLLLAFSPRASAQDIKGGKVEYDQTNYHKLEKYGKPKIDKFISSLPSTTIDSKVLEFSSKTALYKESLKPEDPALAKMKMGIKRVSFLKPPTVKLREVYTDLRSGKQLRQLEFMSRFFLMEEKTGQSAWKIETEQVKILGYTCQKASMQKGGKTITAWFTPEIPVSIGPAEYEGLPGLILSVEEDGRNIILATSVDLSKPDRKLKKPKEGTKVDQEKLDKIIAGKIEEWKKQQQNRGRNRGGKR